MALLDLVRKVTRYKHNLPFRGQGNCATLDTTVIIFPGLGASPSHINMADISIDTATQSNCSHILTKHVAFQWEVNFDSKVLSGSATHTMEVTQSGLKEIVFDTSDLDIITVAVDGMPAEYVLGVKRPIMGSALRISLPGSQDQGATVLVEITYKTGAQNSALQWLDKEQTQGKLHPYLFSQCQPIYARALAPLQDTPANKFTYSAEVSAKLPVLLSARRVYPLVSGAPHDGKVIGEDIVTYRYNQPVPIPSYLLAIAVGNVRYLPFDIPKGKDWTSGIWAEPESIEAAHWEFKDATTRYLVEEENIVAPYQFGVYDLLVLPPSFPYGGMENACLSFLTPTLLTGDRTLVNVVVHELTHSWFGNGITHANPSHFWLNEGWTTYIERLLRELIDGPAARGFAYVIGAKSLYNALKQLQNRPKYHHLVISFDEGEDPDGAYSRVPYEKGANFILYLERILGGLEIFLPYIKDYFLTFKGKSIRTAEWKEHLYTYWSVHGGPEKLSILDNVDWNAWLYGEGLDLPVTMEYDESLAIVAYKLAERWHSARSVVSKTPDFKKSDLDSFDSNQIIVFLEKLESYPPLPHDLIYQLGDIYKLASTPNSEIRLRFYQIALADTNSVAAKDFAPRVAQWITGTDGFGIIKGRMKFCRPMFKAIAAVDKALAIEYWTTTKKQFHPVAIRIIDRDLGLA